MPRAGLLLTYTLAALVLGQSAPGRAQDDASPTIMSALQAGDMSLAARLAREQAEAGDAEAQHHLSLFLWHGVGAPQNFEEALRWSTLSSVRGQKKATAARRLMLRGLDPDLAKKAMDWTRKQLVEAAERGDDDALVALARSYDATFGFVGEVDAYVFSCIAVSVGKIEARRQRDLLVARLKPADLIKAQQRANEWFGRFRKVAA